ncbi:Ribosomal protein S12 methylthiotransferase RimO [Nymphon striatum]|nr:Ribosomal protein S12 methylthiotransferase RimO [Nymphon striatum]
MSAALSADEADLIVVNTCAFIEEAREESIHTILALDNDRAEDAKLVVTGCMAERYGDELAEALPEADSIAGFGVPVTIGSKPSAPLLDLLHLPRPASKSPWAYVKIAEGCDRNCGFCAIPTFRGPQRSRTIDDICAEVEALQAKEIVLVAQDLAAFGRDQGVGERSIVPLVQAVSSRVDWVRLLYLYPSDLTDELIDAMCNTGVPYFDLSLQHVSRPLMRRMRRWGSGELFIERIEKIREREPEAAKEEGTYAADLDGEVDAGLVSERLGELREIQDLITEEKRDEMIGRQVQVLVDEPGVARTHREAPEIDGIVEVPTDLAVGEFATVTIANATGPDLVAEGAESGLS